MTENKDKCPTLQELQDYACGCQDAAIEEHLHLCKKCSDAVEKEKTLNSILDQYMAPPESLNDRILQACKDAKEEDGFLMDSASSRSQRHTHRAWYSYAAAAALVLIGVLVGVLIPTSTDQAMKSSSAMMADAVPVKDAAMLADVVVCDAPVIAMVDESPAPAPAPLMMAKAFAPIQEENIAKPPVMVADASEGFSLKDSLAVSNGRTIPQEVTTVSLRNSTLHGNHKAKLSPVAEEVTHVWLAESMPSDAELQAIAKENHSTICTPSAVDSQGVLTISLAATDQDVQQIADKLYGDNHWKLLSPASPQPSMANRTPLNGHTVKYNIKVVPNK